MMPVATLFTILLFLAMSHSQSIQIVIGVVPRTLDTYPYDSTSVMHFQFTVFTSPSRFNHPQNCSDDNHHYFISVYVTGTLDSMFVALSKEYHSLVTEDPLTVTMADNAGVTWNYLNQTAFLDRSTYNFADQMPVSFPMLPILNFIVVFLVPFPMSYPICRSTCFDLSSSQSPRSFP
jgi:hypothetical protein